jgi:hypothetical protein
MTTSEHIRLDVNQSISEYTPELGEERSPSWMAQPGASLSELSSGFRPQNRVGDCKPSYYDQAVRCRGILASSGVSPNQEALRLEPGSPEARPEPRSSLSIVVDTEA